MSKFDAQANRFLLKVDKKVDGFVRAVAIKLFTRIVERTPVDTGRARASWTIAAGQLGAMSADTEKINFGDGGVLANRGPATAYAMAAARAVPPARRYVIANNLPYIEVLENGGYPVPVKLGTWNPRTKQYEIRSSGGFSKQAPAGMVALAVADTRQELASLRAVPQGGAL